MGGSKMSETGNTLTYVTPKLLAQGLLALRENAIMARLVNRDYGSMAKLKGNTIDIPIPSAVAVQDVTPGAYSDMTSDFSPTDANLPLDQWKEAPFYLTDKDMLTCMKGTIPMQASEAIKAIINTVDSYILGLYVGVYGYAGTADVTPFATSVAEATAARKTLTNQLAPLTDRRFVFDADAEANALGLRAFQDASFSGTNEGIKDGKITRKLGFDWHLDQNVPTHTAGTANAACTTDGSAYLTGVKTVNLASAGTGTILEGDIITFAGDAQTYAVSTGDTAIADGGTIIFEPGLKVAMGTSPVAITVKADHVVNLAFHRDAFAFASRPLADNTKGLGSLIQSATDPISGLSLRLEISREHKRTRFSFDMLYGGVLVRPELACRVAG